MRLLVAEPDVEICRAINRACGRAVRVTDCADFASARAHLTAARPDAVVTNLRLKDYNGLHLVLLAKAANHDARCVVHTDRPDLYLIREAQAIGAFYERTAGLLLAIQRYLLADLPARDRRNPECVDRRGVFRGGRRSVDQAALV